jgi:hypothetical protein
VATVLRGGVNAKNGKEGRKIHTTEQERKNMQLKGRSHHHKNTVKKGNYCKPPINVPYKCTFGMPDQGQTLDM